MLTLHSEQPAVWPSNRLGFSSLFPFPFSPLYSHLSPVPDALADLQTSLTGRYAIERELGRGGMATVYLARDLKHDRPVALKVLSPTIAQVIGTERFEREIRLAARLQHSHICSVYDSGESAGQLWYTMPYVEGESLESRLKREGRLPVDDALRITREAAQALAYAHGHGVVHRDIKPANLLLARDGSTLVADFGIARALGDAQPSGEVTITQTGMSPGTPAYMSPEQMAGGRDLDGRSDVYSLGLVLYELLVGERPFRGDSLSAMVQLASKPLPSVRAGRPELPAAADDLLRSSLTFDRDKRPPMAEFGAALDAVRLGSSADRLLGGSAPWRLDNSAGRRLGVGLVIALAAVLAIVAIFLLRRVPAASATLAKSAAVLPFTDLSPGKDQQYFSDGLTEELTTALSRVPGFQVAARSSAFQFRGADVDVREVGKKLGVGTVLEGSVRRSGDQLRISAQLVNTANGFQIWSDTYDRSTADVFAVQEEIAKAIVTALQVRLASGSDTALVQRPTTDLTAYDLYLQGNFALQARTETSIPEAIRYFEQAVARDSSFARAWAGLAEANVLLPLYTGTAPPVSWPKAKTAAQHAIQLGDGLAQAHAALAYGTLLNDWDFPAAEQEFKRAIAADPRYPTAHHWYGDFLTGRNRQEEALVELRKAQELDPLSRIISAEVAWNLNNLHRTAEADSEITRVLRLDPDFGEALFVLGSVRMQQNRWPEAIEATRHALATGGYNAHVAASLIAAYAGSGDLQTARALLDSMTTRATHEYIPPMALAIGHAWLGEIDQAFALLERGIKEKDPTMPEDFFEPQLDPLKKDPRYSDLASRIAGRPVSGER
jgi:serine/threonine-protein kinase